MLRFIWEFVVGDDWRIAVGVATALAANALLSQAGVAAWWLVPLVAAALLARSVAVSARRGNHAGSAR